MGIWSFPMVRLVTVKTVAQNECRWSPYQRVSYTTATRCGPMWDRAWNGDGRQGEGNPPGQGNPGGFHPPGKPGCQRTECFPGIVGSRACFRQQVFRCWASCQSLKKGSPGLRPSARSPALGQHSCCSWSGPGLRPDRLLPERRARRRAQTGHVPTGLPVWSYDLVGHQVLRVPIRKRRSKTNWAWRLLCRWSLSLAIVTCPSCGSIAHSDAATCCRHGDATTARRAAYYHYSHPVWIQKIPVQACAQDSLDHYRSTRPWQESLQTFPQVRFHDWHFDARLRHVAEDGVRDHQRRAGHRG